jgi:hypothetical protein
MPPVSGPTTSSIDPDVLSRLSTPQAADAVRRGNIDEILKVTGISKRDWEDYLKAQSVSLNRDIVQDYQIYSEQGTVPAPQWSDGFSPESGIGKVAPQDHVEFVEAMGRLSGKAMVAGGKSSTSGKGQGAPASLAGQVESYLQETDDVILNVTDKALEMQLEMEYSQQSKKIRDEFLQLLANAKDPETILLALTQYKMREAGAIATRAGRDIQRINQQQSRATDTMQKLNVNDPKYFAQSQSAQQKVSTLSMNMQQKMSLMQTAAQNVESALNFGKSVLGEYSKNKESILRNTSLK